MLSLIQVAASDGSLGNKMEVIIAVAVSLVVQGVKKYFGTDTFGTLLTVLILSLAGGFVYYVSSSAAWWSSFLQILTYAGAIYTYIIRRFEN